MTETGNLREATLLLIREGFAVFYPGTSRKVYKIDGEEWVVDDEWAGDWKLFPTPDQAVDEFLLP